MKVILIRHFETPGNKLKKYIGTTDEDLASRSPIKDPSVYPHADKIYVSPLKRCIQTTQLIYPNQSYQIKDGLKECNFGAFENKNYLELTNDPRYQQWLDSNGTLPFPDGEDGGAFRHRCVTAFAECLKECTQSPQSSNIQTVAFVVHGGTIMSIMSEFDIEKKGYFDYQLKNGCGYLCEWNYDPLSESQICLRCVQELHVTR